MSSLGQFNAAHGEALVIDPGAVGAASWDDTKAIKSWQRAHAVSADGWFGRLSFAAYNVVAGRGYVEPVYVYGVPYLVPGIPRIMNHKWAHKRARKPGQVVDTLLLHQTVTAKLSTMERVLDVKGYGIQSAVEPEGALHLYGDIGLDQMAHGNERNRRSVGLDEVNPYSKLSKPWTTMVDPSPTAWKGREVEVTDAALLAIFAFTRWLTSRRFDGPGGARVEIPNAWPTTPVSAPARGSAEWFREGPAGAGIVAHGHRPNEYPPWHPRAGQEVEGTHSDARRTAWLLRRMFAAVHAEGGSC